MEILSPLRKCLALGAAVLLPACQGAADPSSAQRFVATGELVALSGGGAGASNACFTCHGMNGEGDGAGSPRLAGLDPGYLRRQLDAFADGRRYHPQMNWIARRLGPSERGLVSGHYAAMPFPARTAGRRGGLALYMTGDPGRGLPPCAECHGPDGEGIGPSNPPLAGQPAAYLAAQLDQWRHSRRRTDPANIMLHISQLLSPSESAALAAYAAQLPGGPPSPGSPEGSPAARHAGSRNDVSGRLLHVPESARAAE